MRQADLHHRGLVRLPLLPDHHGGVRGPGDEQGHSLLQCEIMITDINSSSSVHHPAHVAVFSFHNGNYRSDHGATQVQSTYPVIDHC